MTDSELDSLCLPGMRLSLADEQYVAGVGTYELRGYIYASLAGVVKIIENQTVKMKAIFNFSNID